MNDMVMVVFVVVQATVARQGGWVGTLAVAAAALFVWGVADGRGSTTYAPRVTKEDE